MISNRVRIALAVALFLPAALPAAPYLVQDLHPGLLEEVVYGTPTLLPGPDVSYFGATEPAHGSELWRSDGTPAGTWRVTDVCAGRCNSDAQPLRAFQGKIYFLANDGFSGTELWASDGTPGSERRVRDLCPGACSSSLSYFEEVGGRLLFYAAHGPRLQLWRTDGTREGTVPVKYLCTGAAIPDAECEPFPGLFSVGERAFFFIGSTHPELWVTDGTPAGTRLFKEVVPGGPEPINSYLSVVQGPGFAWVWTWDGLWRSDGTAAGTRRLKAASELTSDPNGVSLEVAVNGVLFAMDYSRGLIRSDGTPEGTYRVYDLPAAVRDLVALEDGILFTLYQDDGLRLWTSRGTAETTGPAVNLVGGIILDLESVGDRVLFLLASGDSTEVWTTDGTTAGTHNLGLPDQTLGNYVLDLVPGGRQVYFLYSGTSFFGLWSSDGTEAGTRQVMDLLAPASSGPLAQIAEGNQLLFSAQTGQDEAPLFLTDGTAVGTHVVSTDASWASGFTRFGHRVFFAASGFPTLNPKGLWKTDTTAAGTVQVSPDPSDLSDPAAFGGALLFSSFGELWRSDGTTRGTDFLKDINPYSVDAPHHTCRLEPSTPRPALILRGRLLLSADDGKHGRELWVTNGTTRGTQLFLDLNPLRSPEVPPSCEDDDHPRKDTGLSSNPDDFVQLGSIALFSASDGRTGRELWRTDGLPWHTRRVVDLRPGRPGSAPHDLVAFHGLVYFLASSEGIGEALWRTDGTGRGTELVRDLALDGFPSWGRDLMVVGDRLFFVVFNETTGAELWASGGEPASTALVADLNSGPANASPRELTNVDGVLLFAADDGTTGYEPWRSDGTLAGTFLLADLSPGPDASSPGPFTRVRQLLITGADDGAHGREPWAFPLADVVRH